jgi:N-acetylglucosaminyldiphosphoundecaprenol N-acetyl-beta-D-mannosaminyltransferase
MSETGRLAESNSDTYHVLGVGVHAVQIAGVVLDMEKWISERERSHFIAVTGMHGVVEAHHDPGFRIVLNHADLVVPDGMPLVWLGRIKGHALKRRVYGPELMATFCKQTSAKGYRHFFYGGAPGVADELAATFAARFPGITPVGTYCPPFRALTEKEDIEVIAAINRSRADIVWVGLSTPKQERWMFEHRERLKVPVLVGVGAAFDLHTKRIAQAPEWMRENGFEWLFRLLHEPRRLWKRYLVYGSEFAFCVVLELAGLKKFD